MTEDQIEASARELCRLRGEDPDDRWHPRDGIMGPSLRPRWEWAAEEIRDHAMIETAICQALGIDRSISDRLSAMGRRLADRESYEMEQAKYR